MDRKVDFKVHLSKQLGFLERSCQSYDEGFTDEAIRIATVIRVIIHQTGSSTSLLKHLGATTINLLSTTFEPSSQTITFVGMGMMRVGNGSSEYFPQLGNGPVNDYIPVSKWWNQVVVVLDKKHRITRKNIVLAAANKDGGAHVDKKLSAEYAALAQDGSVGSFVYEAQNSREEKPIESAHLVSLRQMGYELLNSPGLGGLCKG